MGNIADAEKVDKFDPRILSAPQVEQHYHQVETELLHRFTGLEPHEVKNYYVKVNPYCKLRTIEVGFPPQSDQDGHLADSESSRKDAARPKPKLVFIHGYGASGATFWRVMKPLAVHFHVIFVDLPGMGGSTRVPFFCRTPEQAKQFFTDYLEDWRVAMGHLTNFYLAGHSFGGYIAGLYAHIYTEHIRKVIFISPIGFARQPADWSFERVKMHRVMDHKGQLVQPHSMINPSAAQQAVAPLVWSWRISPLKICRTLGHTFTHHRLAQFVEEEMNTEGDTELQRVLVDYLKIVFMMRGTSEAALFVLFGFGMFAEQPLSSSTMLASSDFPLPVSFIFGMHDWVTADGCSDVLLSNKFYASGESQMHVVSKSDHNLASDNPAELAQVIIEDLTGKLHHKFDSKLEMYYLEPDASQTASKGQPGQRSLDKFASEITIHPYNRTQ